MMYYVYLVAFYISRILPIKVSYALADLIARAFYASSRRDRVALEENMRVILGRDAGKKDIGRNVLNVFRNFAKYLADFFKMSKLTRVYIDRHVRFRGLENLDKCLSEGRGVICLALHMGNWELGAALLSAIGYPMNALVLEHKDKRVDDLFVRQRSLNGTCNIPLGMSVKKCFKALRNNEAMAIVGDKDYTSSGLCVDLFGRKTVLPKGPAVISLKTGAPIVFTCLARREDDTFDMMFEEPIKPVKTGDIDRDVHNLMDKYIKVFERYIRQYPDQWYAFKELWTDPVTCTPRTITR